MLRRAANELLEVWSAISRSSVHNERLLWGGREGTDSLTDAQQLLCVLLPATALMTFQLDRPDQTRNEAAARALDALGDSLQIPFALVGIMDDYLSRHTADDGTPVFSAPSRLHGDDVDDELRTSDAVPSFAVSISLCLAMMGFLRVLRTSVRRAERRDQIARVDDMATTRLSAAMIGLLRSFAVRRMELDSPEANSLMALLNQGNRPPNRVARDFRDDLREVISRLRDDVTIGSGEPTGLEDARNLFECGWAWGIIRNAPVVETRDFVGRQRDGLADERPHPYFTAEVGWAVADLESERTRVLGLLNPEQLRFSQSLALRWEICKTYWARVATLGSAGWPVEDLPWRTVDGEESDLLSLMIVRVAAAARLTDGELARLSRLIPELAGRARITYRTVAGDPALRWHEPGFSVPLRSEPSRKAVWLVADYSVRLLSTAQLFANRVTDGGQRRELNELIGLIWAHLDRRRLTDGPGRWLWDQPAGAFADLDVRYDRSSWSFTYAVVGALVTAVHTADIAPRSSARLQNSAMDMIEEAETLLGGIQTLGGHGPRSQAEIEEIAGSLATAAGLTEAQPGTAMALANDVLYRLHRLREAMRRDDE